MIQTFASLGNPPASVRLSAAWYQMPAHIPRWPRPDGKSSGALNVASGNTSIASRWRKRACASSGASGMAQPAGGSAEGQAIYVSGFPDRLARAIDAANPAMPVAAVQLRLKDFDQHTAARLAAPLQAVCRDRGVAFIVNDSIALARRIKADGVHLVGQDDGGGRRGRRLRRLRRILPQHHQGQRAP